MSKIDAIAFCGEAHTQQGFRKLILNLTGRKGYVLKAFKS